VLAAGPLAGLQGLIEFPSRRNEQMGYYEDKEEEELLERYPEGSIERQVIDYSRSKHIQEEVPPMLLAAFKVLMGISVLMAVVSLVAFLSH
jgi:hypothetical protein